MNEIHKVCPDCGDEFESWVETCPDCGVALRWKADNWGGQGTIAAPEGRLSRLPPLEASPELTWVRAEEPGWIEALAARLAGAGIRSFVSLAPDPSIPPDHQGAWVSQGQGRYYLFVRPEDYQASLEVDRALLLEQFADGDGFDGFPTQREGTCPACGGAVPEGAEACPSCDLVFPCPEADEGSPG